MTRGLSFAPYVRLRLKAMSRFNISPMEWEKMSDQWKADLIAYEERRAKAVADMLSSLKEHKKAEPSAIVLLLLEQI